MPEHIPLFRSLREFTAWLQLTGIARDQAAAERITRLVQEAVQ